MSDVDAGLRKVSSSAAGFLTALRGHLGEDARAGAKELQRLSAVRASRCSSAEIAYRNGPLLNWVETASFGAHSICLELRDSEGSCFRFRLDHVSALLLSHTLQVHLAQEMASLEGSAAKADAAETRDEQ